MPRGCCRFNMADAVQATSEVETSYSENIDAKLLFLPEKLRERLLPFQKKGIIFALERSGRWGWGRQFKQLPFLTTITRNGLF
ncbi:hypothetical protein Y1Q_0011682 [Alligator mississippiensis]|uniref:Uncharacterized protein n=1 Tax=Alligator mississippiensis TaxID=8496 RepID=A0A151M0R5_ALLMI|nr:hypothetical protein Y1Q_0011682 [Alligator mississippiensis]